jgi:hypothetical protein
VYRDSVGASHEEIAAEINAVPGRKYSREHLCPWNSERVQSALVRLAYGECSMTAPAGKYRSVQALSEITGASEDVILGLGFLGRLGPARVEDGRLCFRPSLQDLDRWIPEYARGRVARRKGWPLEDVAELWDDRVGATGCTKHALRVAAEEGRLAAVRDRVGRHYARISEMRSFGASLENALAKAPEEWRALDRSRWLRAEEVQKRFPTVARDTIMKHCTHILKQGRVAWYYIDESAEARFARPTLQEQVAALGDESLRIEEFYTYSSLIEELRTRFGKGSRKSVCKRLKVRDLLSVEVWKVVKSRPKCSVHYHIPEEAFRGGFDAFLNWLTGSSPAADKC